MANYTSNFSGQHNDDYNARITALENNIFNYPTLQGDGATGTWGISITGNATTADKINNNGIIGTDVRHDGRSIIIRPNDFPIVENVASYYSDQGSVTGTFKITLPLNNGDCVMQILELYLYDYNSQAGNLLIISGYTYINKDWYNYSCRATGHYSKGCRMAFDGTNYCVLLGTTSTTWNYPKLWLSKWIGGYSNRMSIVNKGLPTISLITSESGYIITGSAS